MGNFKNRKNPVEVSQDNQNIKCFNLIMTYDTQELWFVSEICAEYSGKFLIYQQSVELEEVYAQRLEASVINASNIDDYDLFDKLMNDINN